MDRYQDAGLNFNIISDKFPNREEYEEIVNVYLADEFFMDLKDYLEQEDYAMAKDAVKGLYILAQDLCLYPLYIALYDIYDDLDNEDYAPCITHYEEMIKVYEKIRGVFYV